MIKFVKGDLIKLAKEGQFDVIAHGANCFHTFGAGIAKKIAKEFPEAYQADLATVPADRNKLGTYSKAEIVSGAIKFTVVNAYTQFLWGMSAGPPVSYPAVKSCMKAINNDFPNLRIGLPKIGAGLAGGDWERILKIIEKELSEQDVTIVEWDK